jgi:hypothetical protein
MEQDLEGERKWQRWLDEWAEEHWVEHRSYREDAM